jgi:hypothetical protein
MICRSSLSSPLCLWTYFYLFDLYVYRIGSVQHFFLFEICHRLCLLIYQIDIVIYLRLRTHKYIYGSYFTIGFSWYRCILPFETLYQYVVCIPVSNSLGIYVKYKKNGSSDFSQCVSRSFDAFVILFNCLRIFFSLVCCRDLDFFLPSISVGLSYQSIDNLVSVSCMHVGIELIKRPWFKIFFVHF